MISSLPQVFIDGPFGAPTSQIFRAQHAVLIGTGIGVTPFASILQSIMHRYWQERNECPRCKYNWTNDLSSSSVLNLRKVDFFWINRDQVRRTHMAASLQSQSIFMYELSMNNARRKGSC